MAYLELDIQSIHNVKQSLSFTPKPVHVFPTTYFLSIRLRKGCHFLLPPATCRLKQAGRPGDKGRRP